MQFLSLLLSLIFALVPAFPFLAPAQAAPPEASLSQRAREMITEEQLVEVALAMEALQAEAEENNMLDFFPLTLLDDFWKSLAVAYTYSCFYSVEDGLTPAEALRSQFGAAGRSTVVSMTLYDNGQEPMKYDASQHFTWGFHSTRAVGLEKSRILQNNYEIAVFFKNPSVEFIKERYLDFLAEGQGEWEARWNAWVEGGALGLNMRELLLEECADREGFDKHYSDDEIMDLWNNEKGRQAYLNTGLLGGIAFRQFRMAWDGGELIESYEYGASTATQQRQFIFENTYLWNPTVRAVA